MDTIALVISVLTLFASFFFYARNDKRVKAEVLKTFYEEGNSLEIVSLTRKLYEEIKKNPKFCRSDFQEIGTLICFFDKWTTLCDKGYLPLWAYKGNPGFHLVVFYEYIKSYMQERRKQNVLDLENINYLWTVEKIAKKAMKKFIAKKHRKSRRKRL